MAWVDRSYFAARRRFHRAGIVGSMLAVVVTYFHVAPNVHGAEVPVVDPAGWSVLGAALMLALAAVLPWTLAKLGWRVHRRRWLAEA